MLNELIFYNEFGAGDLFESREFVRDYMRLLPAEKYGYAHSKSPRILEDIPELSHVEITSLMNCRMPFVTSIDENSLYINTWIGRTSQYVLPGIGCVVERLYDMHNSYLMTLCGKRLLRGVYEYIPNIDYSYYYTEEVDNFVKDTKKDKRMVLIDNGMVMSKQASNFDFSPVIRRLGIEYPEIIFVTTHKIENVSDNIYDTKFIINKNFTFDLNEISYIGSFCDVLIGRCSGPHVFCQTLNNWLDSSKTLVSFTYHPNGSSFVRDSNMLKMKTLWSDSVNETGVFNVCRRSIDNGK